MWNILYYRFSFLQCINIDVVHRIRGDAGDNPVNKRKKLKREDKRINWEGKEWTGDGWGGGG